MRKLIAFMPEQIIALDMCGVCDLYFYKTGVWPWLYLPLTKEKPEHMQLIGWYEALDWAKERMEK